MLKTLLIVTCCLTLAGTSWSQANPRDTTPSPVADTLVSGNDSLDLNDIDIDQLLNEFDLFLDSILTPRSYVLLNLSVTQGYFNFTNKNNLLIREAKKAVWSPMFGYYDKSGFGITLASYVIYDSSTRYVYQTSFSPSYDYLKNRKLATGVSYSRYITRTRLPFYTSPLQNELNGYFLWRKSFLQPGLAVSYGWGNRTEFVKREKTYQQVLTTTARNGDVKILDTISVVTRVLTKNSESVVDFSTMFSVRHDFYWLEVFSRKDHIRFSPLLAVTAGTQKFGFNHESATSFSSIRAATYYSSRNVSLRQEFQLLSSTLYLRGEYFIGKFFLQPQVIFDYYFPGKNSGFTTLFSFNTGFLF